MTDKTEIFNLLREIFRETRQFEEALRQHDLGAARSHIERRGVLFEELSEEASGYPEGPAGEGSRQEIDLMEELGELVGQVEEIEERCREEMEKRIERISDDLAVGCRKGYIHKWLDSQMRLDRSAFVDVRDEDAD